MRPSRRVGTGPVAGGGHIERLRFHQGQGLQPLGERGLAAAGGTQQIQDLLPLLEPLRRVLEVADDALVSSMPENRMQCYVGGPRPMRI
jgi:hypothetical protein